MRVIVVARVFNPRFAGRGHEVKTRAVGLLVIRIYCGLDYHISIIEC